MLGMKNGSSDIQSVESALRSLVGSLPRLVLMQDYIVEQANQRAIPTPLAALARQTYCSIKRVYGLSADVTAVFDASRVPPIAQANGTRRVALAAKMPNKVGLVGAGAMGYGMAHGKSGGGRF